MIVLQITSPTPPAQEWLLRALCFSGSHRSLEAAWESCLATAVLASDWLGGFDSRLLASPQLDSQRPSPPGANNSSYVLDSRAMYYRYTREASSLKVSCILNLQVRFAFGVPEPEASHTHTCLLFVHVCMDVNTYTDIDYTDMHTCIYICIYIHYVDACISIRAYEYMPCVLADLCMRGACTHALLLLVKSA